MRKQKSILKSKVFWAVVIPMLIEITNLLLSTPIFPEKYRGFLTLLSGFLVIIFRATSTTEIKPIITKKETE